LRIHLAEVYGFCKGVERSVKLADELLDHHPGEKCYSIGTLVHNSALVEHFEKKGLEVISSPDGHEPGLALIRAHGIPERDEKAFIDAGFTLIDGTCRLVKRNHTQAAASAFPIIFLGKKNHAETISTVGHAKQKVYVLSDLEDLKQIDKNQLYTVIIQTTFPSSTLESFRSAFAEGGYRVVYTNNICKASQRRRESVLKLASECQAIVVVGDEKSTNTMSLYQLASRSCDKAFRVSSPEEVTKEMASFDDIGVTAGASVSDSIIEAVIRRLEEYAS